MAQTNVLDLLGSISEQCRECPIPTMLRVYNDVARDFCRRTRWLRKTINSIDTVIDQTDYVLTADTYNDYLGVYSVALQEDATKTIYLVEQASSFWDPDQESDLPDRFEYVPNGIIRLDSPPNAVYPLVVVAFMQPKRADTTIDSTLADNWEEGLKAGVVSRLKGIPRMPWSDPADARMQGLEYNSQVGSASILADSGNNPGGRTGTCGGPPNARIRSRILTI